MSGGVDNSANNKEVNTPPYTSLVFDSFEDEENAKNAYNDDSFREITKHQRSPVNFSLDLADLMVSSDQVPTIIVHETLAHSSNLKSDEENQINEVVNEEKSIIMDGSYDNAIDTTRSEFDTNNLDAMKSTSDSLALVNNYDDSNENKSIIVANNAANNSSTNLLEQIEQKEEEAAKIEEEEIKIEKNSSIQEHEHRRDASRRRSRNMELDLNKSLDESTTNLNKSSDETKNETKLDSPLCNLKPANKLFTSLSPIKKKRRLDSLESPTKSLRLSMGRTKTSSLSDESDAAKLRQSLIQDLRNQIKLSDELNTYDEKNEDVNEDDEFFLAISSTRLETGSCPDFYWYPTALTNSGVEFEKPKTYTPISKRRTKSVNDLSYSTIKSYENITHSNYVQMVNSMITGAMSDVADHEYIQYVKRHIQGLFDNYTPVLMKSKSNEEMAMNSPSRDKIVEMINSSMPKSFSLDFQMLEESKINDDNDAMDFSKFGLGIEEKEPEANKFNSEEISYPIEMNQKESDSVELNESIESVNSNAELIRREDANLVKFELNELKSSTKIGFDEFSADSSENNSSKPDTSVNNPSETATGAAKEINNTSDNDSSATQVNSESTVSTVVAVRVKDKETDSTLDDFHYNNEQVVFFYFIN
jgi:hypothetical protein